VLTVAEAGIPEFDFPIWYGVWAPAGTPPDVVVKLAADIARALASQELRSWMDDHGASPMTMTQTEFTRFVERESERAKRLVKAGAAYFRRSGLGAIVCFAAIELTTVRL